MRVVVVSAAIGAGHDVPARVLADDLRAAGCEVVVLDGLAAMGRLIERVALGGSSFGSAVGDRLFDLEHRLVHDLGPTRRLAGALMLLAGGRGLLRAVAASRPGVVVSTYPGTTEMLGRLRLGGRLPVPVVSAITDLAALRWWAHPGVDLHLVTHAESIAEVRAVAGETTDVVHCRGLDDPRFAAPPSRAAARRALGLPAEGAVVAVSGGGWGIGDLAGATEEALALPDARVVALCGNDDAARRRLEQRFGDGGRVIALGFTDRMPEVLAAADVLVHSTAGLTVLEALVLGCPVVSYGWGRGHLRANDAAYEQLGLATVARDRAALGAGLRAAIARRRSPDPTFAALPTAAAVILERSGGRAAGAPVLTRAAPVPRRVRSPRARG